MYVNLFFFFTPMLPCAEKTDSALRLMLLGETIDRAVGCLSCCVESHGRNEHWGTRCQREGPSAQLICCNQYNDCLLWPAAYVCSSQPTPFPLWARLPHSLDFNAGPGKETIQYWGNLIWQRWNANASFTLPNFMTNTKCVLLLSLGCWKKVLLSKQ